MASFLTLIGDSDPDVQAAASFFTQRSVWANPARPGPWLGMVVAARPDTTEALAATVAADCRVAIHWHATEGEATAAVRATLDM